MRILLLLPSFTTTSRLGGGKCAQPGEIVEVEKTVMYDTPVERVTIRHSLRLVLSRASVES